MEYLPPWICTDSQAVLNKGYADKSRGYKAWYVVKLDDDLTG